MAIIKFRVPFLEAYSKKEAENKISKLINFRTIDEFIQHRQHLSIEFNIVKSVATWDNIEKIYQLEFVGIKTDSFLKKILESKYFKRLTQEFSNNEITFLKSEIIKDCPSYYEFPKYFKDLINISNESLYDNSAKYKLNSFGYRCPEFKDVSWENSIVLLGCSNTCSIGLEESESLTTQLSKKIKKPVISLGVPGSSCLFSFYNSILLKDNFPEPLAVIHIWSEIERYTSWEDKQVRHQGSAWNTNYLKFFTNTDFFINLTMYHTASKHMWKNYLAYSFFNSTASFLHVPELSSVDQAKDNSHPGPVSVKLAAERMSKDITTLGIC